MKLNKTEIFKLTFEEVASTTKSGFESISKLRSSILEKINGNFDQYDKPNGNTFDISKLENLKKQNDLNFIEQMQNLKKGKQALPNPEVKPSTPGHQGGIMDLDFTQKHTTETNPDHQKTNAQSFADNLNSNSTENGNFDVDFLGGLSNDVTVSQNPPKFGSDSLLDFNITPNQQVNQVQGQQFVAPSYEISFDTKPIPPKSDVNSSDSKFSPMNFNLMNSADDQNNRKGSKGDRDIFDFIV